jgi:2-keto-4-pentenoate hydratase/2-oxohepta-3-ene-1,7-dioic acid hydratase in catechol pathway
MKSIYFDEKAIVPSKIICIGRNYVDHIEELDNEIPEEMVVFMKPNSAISAQLSSFQEEALHYEAELCFLYQKDVYEQGKHQSGKFTAVAVGLDLTKRNLQTKLKAKGFDGSAIFSNFVKIDKLDTNLSLELKIDNTVTQAGGIELMMYKPEDILAQLVSFLTLEDGDIVMTGTPKGVGAIKSGSKFEGKVILNNKTLVSSFWLAK